jgi:branched-chain amino acid transport system substrate-binding protein
MANGMQLFFEEHGFKLAGREIKLITEDDEGKPPTGLAKARSLVESQGVHVLMGPLSAAVGYAVAGYVNDKKVPTIFPIVSAEDITQRKRAPTSSARAGRAHSRRSPSANGCTTTSATGRLP